jgi:asparaginyl-tRNA synthetase
MLRCRHNLTNIINNYLFREGFIQIHTPILTSNDCEGAGEVFTVKPDSDKLLKTMRRKETDKDDEIYFNRKVFLTVSGQLHIEAMSHGLARAYTLGPTFRAENSKSSVHLSEFYMLELEESFIESIEDVIRTISRFFKVVSKEFLDTSAAEVTRINKSNKSFNIDEHFKWLEKDFQVMTYNDAFEIITNHQDKFKNPPKFEDGLSKENEIFLATHCNGPCYVIDWPKNQKSFYMRQRKDNPEIVEALDFIIPHIGEVAGGSVREDNYDVLKSKMPPDDSLKWYLDLRKYGSVTTGGFGMGFERYLQFLLNIHSIKDVIPFPRWAHNCSM